MVCSQVIASSNYSLHRSELGPLTASPVCLTSHPYTMGPLTASPACLTPHPYMSVLTVLPFGYWFIYLSI